MNSPKPLHEVENPPAFGEAPGALSVLLVYEDFTTGLQARLAFERVERRFESAADFKVDLWKLALLREPALLEEAVTEAARADLVFLSVHGRGGRLPALAHGWLGRWFERCFGRPCALVVLLEALAGTAPAMNPASDSLRAAALAAGVDMFLCTAPPLQTERPSALDQLQPPPDGLPSLPLQSRSHLDSQPYSHWGINE